MPEVGMSDVAFGLFLLGVS